MNFIDTHSHLFAEAFDEDRAEVVAKCVSAGVDTIILPNIDIASIKPLKTLMASYPNIMYGAMGLHPTFVNAGYIKHLERIKQEVYSGKYISIGEIGIDLYWEQSMKVEQEDVFRQQLSWALDLELPVIIHSRGAESFVLDILSEAQYSNLKGVLHCWGGNSEETIRAIELGYYIGIGGVVTFKKSHLPDILKLIPQNLILSETDSPYLSPVPFRGKRNDSSRIPLIVLKISEIREEPLDEVKSAIISNTRKLFNI